MWDAADLDTLINPDMPGYALGTKADLSTVDGLFRNGYAEAFGMVSGSNPRFYCAESTAPGRQVPARRLLRSQWPLNC